MTLVQTEATLVATVLFIDAAIHAYWLTGRVWPASDVRQLSRAVLNIEAPFTPRVLIPLIVVLGAGAWTLLAAAGVIPAGLPSWMVRTACGAVLVGFTARAVAGVAWLFSARRDTFHRLNRSLYTPLCVVLAVATAGVLFGWG
jgi:hypothetical protein